MGQTSSVSGASGIHDIEMGTPERNRERNDLDEDGIPSEEMRTVIWEVNVARESLKNFGPIINAHAIVLSLLVTVTYVGFLQPPRGFTNDGHVLFESAAVNCFIVFNSLSLYSAICGLLVYVHCSYASIMTLGSVPIPDRLNDYSVSLLHKLRSALRQVALPAMRARSKILFLFLTISLGCCVVAFASAGFAVVGSSRGGILSVLLPLIAGGILIVSWICRSALKMWMEVKFEDRLRYLWASMKKPEPEVEVLLEEAWNKLDPDPIRSLLRGLKGRLRSR